MIDVIYCISLERLPERRKRAIEILKQIKFCSIIFLNAVDSHNYKMNDFNKEGIFAYDNWEMGEDDCVVKIGGRDIDFTYWKRPVTMGEMGCAVSHYLVWKNIFKSNYKNALIFEDDIDFEVSEFLQGLETYSKFSTNNQCDLFYLGCLPWDDGERVYENVLDKLRMSNRLQCCSNSENKFMTTATAVSGPERTANG